jgi:hypothetical protein
MNTMSARESEAQIRSVIERRLKFSESIRSLLSLKQSILPISTREQTIDVATQTFMELDKKKHVDSPE